MQKKNVGAVGGVGLDTDGERTQEGVTNPIKNNCIGFMTPLAEKGEKRGQIYFYVRRNTNHGQ